MKKKRILTVLPDLGGGGSERVMSTVLKNLDRRKFDLHLALLDGNCDFAYSPPDDVKLTRLNCSRVRNSFLPLLQLIRREKPDVVFSSVDHLNLMAISLKPLFPRGTKSVVRPSSISSAALDKDPTSVFSRRCYRFFYSRADLVICQTNYMRSDFEVNFGVQREKLARIYNPLDIDAIDAMIASENNPFTSNGPNLVFAGRLVHQKGVDILLKSFQRFTQKMDKAHLWILGTGPLENMLKTTCIDFGISRQVHFMGFVKNPYVWFKHADLFVLPSRFEGLSNALLEALACGCPVVAGDGPGGTREIMEVTGNAERLLPLDRFRLEKKMLVQDAGSSQVRNVLEKYFSLGGVMSSYEDLLINL